jgi:hypothetical protein
MALVGARRGSGWHDARQCGGIESPRILWPQQLVVRLEVSLHAWTSPQPVAYLRAWQCESDIISSIREGSSRGGGPPCRTNCTRRMPGVPQLPFCAAHLKQVSCQDRRMAHGRSAVCEQEGSGQQLGALARPAAMNTDSWVALVTSSREAAGKKRGQEQPGGNDSARSETGPSKKQRGENVYLAGRTSKSLGLH